MARFTCAQCGRPVIVLDDGEKVRKCGHNEAPIHANLKATVYSKGCLAVVK